MEWTHFALEFIEALDVFDHFGDLKDWVVEFWWGDGCPRFGRMISFGAYRCGEIA